MLDRLRQAMFDHPKAVGVLFAVLVAWSVLDAYEIGMRIGEARGVHGEAARAASEALGG